MKINIDKYTFYTWLWWIVWSIAFAAAEYVSFYMPVDDIGATLPIWKIWILESIWLILGATMMLIMCYQYKHHPSKLWVRIKNKKRK